MTAHWRQYWHEFRLHPARIAALRWAIFGLVALDMWALMLEHGSRYGAGEFNVAQLPLLDWLLPVPTPGVIAAGWLLGGFFALRAALGVAIRTSMIGATVCYGGIYLWSQADSYQHHYLVALLLFIGCFVPESVWRGRAQDNESQWALRLVYVQLAVTYFWTAVTKVDATWLTGDTMIKLTSDPCIQGWVAEFEANRGWEAGSLYTLSALGIIFGEFFAAAVFLWRRLWLVGLVVIPWFHVGVEVLGFEIEWFSYYMIALNLILLSPDALWARIDRWLGPARARLARDIVTHPTHLMGIAAGAAAVAFVLALQSPVSTHLELAVIIAVFTLLALWPLRQNPLVPRYAAGVHALVAAAMLMTVHVSESAYDFYRLWGGDLRRRGDLEAATDKYIQANALMEDVPARRYQLAKLYERTGHQQEALRLYRETHRIYVDQVARLTRTTLRDPTDADALFELAGDQLRLAERCGALAKAERRAGNADAATEAQACRKHGLDGASETLDRGFALRPCDPREGHRMRRQLRKTRGG